jgi:hypothetical protein
MERLQAAHEEMSEAMERGEDIPASSLAVIEEYALGVSEKRDSCAAMMRMQESGIEHLSNEITRLSKIKAMREGQLERFREHVLGIMQAHNLTKMSGADSTFTVIQNQPTVEVGLDAAALPEKFQRVVPAKVEADKVAIKAALKADEEVPGCRLKPGTFRLAVK